MTSPSDTATTLHEGLHLFDGELQRDAWLEAHGFSWDGEYLYDRGLVGSLCPPAGWEVIDEQWDRIEVYRVGSTAECVTHDHRGRDS